MPRYLGCSPRRNNRANRGRASWTVELSVHGEHLRRQFPDSGDLFVLRLETCTMLRFRPYEYETVTVTDLEELARADLQILSAVEHANYCQVHCHARTGAAASAPWTLRLAVPGCGST